MTPRGQKRSITTLVISNSTTKKLRKASVRTVGELVELCEREILAIKGIGPSTLDEIKEALDSKGMTLAYDPYEKQICARHNKKRNDARLRSYFLCKDCGIRFQTRALNKKHPVFYMELAKGPYRCSHCNEIKEIALYQWFVCDICDRVLRSIGRGITSNKGVIDWWSSQKILDSSLPEIIETDPPDLKSIANNDEEPKLDFEWKDSNDVVLFGAEVKTGRNHLQGGTIGSGMSQFQLDVSDIESILDAMERDGSFVPAFVLHCQVVDVPEPPTQKFDCVGIWWTSIDNLIDHIQEIKQRPRENRPAAYISTNAFNNIDSLIDEVKSEGYINCSDPSHLRSELESKIP